MTLALSQDNTESLEHSPISNGTATPLVPIPVSGHSMWPTLHPDDILWTRLAPTQLRPGDIALFRRGDELFSHRFLGFRHHDQQRFLLAKGDGSWAFDPLWPEQTLFGVAESIERNAVSHPLTTISAWRRWLAVGLGLLKGAIYHMKYRFFAILLILILLTSVTEASVTLTTFTATFQGNGVLLHWETASEVNALGFNLYRSLLPAGEEVLLNPDIILAQGGITGGTYDFSDENPPVADGYQYRLEEIDANGQIESFTPVVLSRITATPTATPSATLTSPTNTPTASPEPTNTPTTTASFTATPTPTAFSSPALTPATSPTPTPITSPTLSASPTLVFTSTPAPTPTAKPIPPTATALPALTPNPTPTSTSIAAPATTATPTASPAAIAAIPAATPVPLRFPAAGNSSSPSAARNPNLVYGLVGILSLLGAAILVVILIHLRGGWRR